MKKILCVLSAGLLAAGVAQAENITYADGAIINDAQTIGGADRLLQNADATVTITNGGSLTITTTTTTAGSLIGQLAEVAFIIDGGAFNLNSSANLILGNGTGGDGTIDLRDGTLSLTTTGDIVLARDGSTGVITIRGGVATLDQPVFDTYFPDDPGAGSIDFADKIGGGASDGTLTIAGADLAYFQGLYSGDDLTYNGDNSAAFSSVFSVDGSTLSVVPEPATLGLVAVFGGGILFIRRRFMI
ncbi:PEP-CTERM sorting domain-containing protein [Pontiellaceae bacterium B1224]|nr:PEP-CTERM sorting domain-containing protein [Pontiellaceae bacterium B1224]